MKEPRLYTVSLVRMEQLTAMFRLHTLRRAKIVDEPRMHSIAI